MYKTQYALYQICSASIESYTFKLLPQTAVLHRLNEKKTPDYSKAILRSYVLLFTDFNVQVVIRNYNTRELTVSYSKKNTPNF